MGVARLRPGTMKRIGTMSPDDHKRQSSGFWSYEERIDTGACFWRCDVDKLTHVVSSILKDRAESNLYLSLGPEKYLDTRFGNGTGRAFLMQREPGQKYVQWCRSELDMQERRFIEPMTTSTGTRFMTTGGTATNQRPKPKAGTFKLRCGRTLLEELESRFGDTRAAQLRMRLFNHG